MLIAKIKLRIAGVARITFPCLNSSFTWKKTAMTIGKSATMKIMLDFVAIAIRKRTNAPVGKS